MAIYPLKSTDLDSGIYVLCCSSLLPQPLVRGLYLNDKDMACSNKCRNKPLVELVHSLQVRVVRQPHILIYEVESSMSYELVEMMPSWMTM